MEEDIERLLLEIQRSRLTERRTEARHPFVRPVAIFQSTAAPMHGFSRDISRVGMTVIVDEPLSVGTVAILQIHSLQGLPVCLRCDVRWCDPYGRGWYQTGWKFLASAAPPPEAIRLNRRVDPGTQ